VLQAPETSRRRAFYSEGDCPDGRWFAVVLARVNSEVRILPEGRGT